MTKMYIALKVQYALILSDFNESCVFVSYFRKKR